MAYFANIVGFFFNLVYKDEAQRLLGMGRYILLINKSNYPISPYMREE